MEMGVFAKEKFLVGADKTHQTGTVVQITVTDSLAKKRYLPTIR